MMGAPTPRELFPEELRTIRRVLCELDKCRKGDDVLAAFAERQFRDLSFPVLMWARGFELS